MSQSILGTRNPWRASLRPSRIVRRVTSLPIPAGRTVGWAAILGLALILQPPTSTPLSAQEEDIHGPGGFRPRMFFDCDGRNCRSDYYRTEITFVNWVRLPEDSDVHVIMTSEQTGAGGRQYQIDLMGVGAYSGYEDQMLIQTLPTDTEREALDEISHALAVGLARFAAISGFGDVVRVIPTESPGLDPGARLVSEEEVDDPWNLWVFRINGSANFDGEETRNTRRIDGSFSASRVTPTWKMSFRGNVNNNRREIELQDQDDFVDDRTDWGFNQLIVYSLAENWSVGLQGEVRRIVRFNQDLRFEMTPAVEYSFFPYEEATRRALTAFYKIGPAYRDYIETTAFGEEAETRWEQSLELEFSQRQPWGDASIRITGSHFLHDFDLYNLRMNGNVDYRIVRGISVNVRGNVGWVNDQIYLSAGGATDAEALLNLRQRNQDFTYSMRVGFSIQFGSIFNNVVNNRFGGGGGGGGGGFFGFR